MTARWLWRGKWFWGYTRLHPRPERWAIDLGPLRIMGSAGEDLGDSGVGEPCCLGDGAE